MKRNDYDRVCYRTEQRDESVAVRNIKGGNVGYSFGCTYAGETVQVRLPNGELDSWSRDDCEEEK
jgi:hypothetical protein